jgi:protoporphyrinogen/coproporphyrinogen III oxidase
MPFQPAQRHVAVIGGGIAGLAAAHALLTARPDLAVTVLESSPTLGGKLRLGEVGGQPVDVGAEALLNRRPEATALARAVGLGPALVHPVTSDAAIWSRGSLRTLPPTVLGVPADVRAAARSGLLDRRAALRARVERRLPALRLEHDVAVGRLVARRLGSQVSDRLVEPLLGGVYAGCADELSFAATMPQLSQALSYETSLLAAAERVRAASQPATGAATVPVFAGIAGGVGRLPGVVADDLVSRGAVIRASATVRSLDRTASGWRAVVGPTTAPEELEVDGLVVATPAVAASRLLKSVAPVAADELGHIEYASLALVTLAMRADDVSSRLVGSGFLVPPVDGRAIKAVTYSSRKWGWLDPDIMVIRCSIGRHREPAQLQRDDRELVALAAADLRDATGLDAPVVDATVTRWGGSLPQYAVGHLERVARIQAAVVAVPGLELCGAAFQGVGIAAVIASAQQAATRLLRYLNEPGQWTV